MKERLAKLVLSAWVWSILPSIVVSLLLKDMRQHYTVTITNNPLRDAREVAYHDLNGDGYSELIVVKPGPPLNSLPVMDSEGNFFDQWNLPGDLTPDGSQLYFGDFDQDSLAEIYIFTTRHDSLFLNVNEFFESSGLHLEQVFITTVNRVEDVFNSQPLPIGFFDHDKDGKQEFYFCITTGFGLWPRLCYSYDLVNGKLKSSSFTGINFNNPALVDIDGDLRPEIFSHTSASGNYRTPTPYTDYSAWLMVLTDELEFKFQPVEFEGFGGTLDVFKLNNNLLAVYNFQGALKSTRQPSAMIFSPEGKLIRERNLSEVGITSRVQTFVIETIDGDQILLLGNSLVLLNDDLQEISKIKAPFQTDYLSIQLDLDFDGTKEIVLISKEENKLAVFKSDLEECASVPFDASGLGSEWHVSSLTDRRKESKMFIHSGLKAFFLQMKENPLYWTGFLAYPAIYFGFVLFLWVLKKANARQVERRESQKRKLQTLQLQNIKGQLDPHFTFNALNTVAALLYLDDRKTAYDHLNKFTRLLRQMLNDAERVDRTVEEELELVKVYLEMEKLRFGDRFQYFIKEGEGVTGKELIPVLSIQTFVENAIKHGLIPRGEGGILVIQIEKKGADLKITVQDNGIGRAAAAINSDGMGRGLKITREFFELLNQRNGQTILHSITDLFDSGGNPAGTKVEIWIH